MMGCQQQGTTQDVSSLGRVSLPTCTRFRTKRRAQSKLVAQDLRFTFRLRVKSLARGDNLPEAHHPLWCMEALFFLST